MIEVLGGIVFFIFGLVFLYLVARVISAGIFRSWMEIQTKMKDHYKEKEEQNGKV